MFEENIDLFFTDFAQEITIEGESALCVFSNEAIDIDGVISNEPHIYIQTSVVEELQICGGEEVIFKNGDTYTTEPPQSDGIGISIIKLSKKWNTFGLN